MWREAGGDWSCEVYADLWNPGREVPDPRVRIAHRDPANAATRTWHPTHQEALDAALVAVGLARPAEHREAP